MKRNRVLGFIVGAALAAGALAGCGSDKAKETEAPAQAGTQQQTEEATQGQAADTIKITFMYQEEELGSAQAAAGEVLEEASYQEFEQMEGASFEGWYETPSFLAPSKKDLTKDTFTEDTVLYGDFRSDNVAEDTRKWYIAGTGKGSLKENNWASALDDAAKETFELKPTGEALNEFALTIDLYQGDQFQIIPDWSWTDQKGYGTFTEIDETQMKNAGGLGGSADTSNVEVLEDGNYTITLTTNPENKAQDTLIIVRNSDPLAAAQQEETDAFVPSEDTTVIVKGSWVEDWSDLKELTREGDSNVYEIEIELAADTELCFSVFEAGEDTGIVLKEENVADDDSKALLAENGSNIQVREDGSYTFTVDLDAMSVSILKK